MLDERSQSFGGKDLVLAVDREVHRINCRMLRRLISRRDAACRVPLSKGNAGANGDEASIVSTSDTFSWRRAAGTCGWQFVRRNSLAPLLTNRRVTLHPPARSSPRCPWRR